jgi:hypothetical protein
MKKVIGFLAIAALASISSAASATAVAKGKVTDSAGNPLPGTIVRLATLGIDVETNANGEYAFPTTSIKDSYFQQGKIGAFAKPMLSCGKVYFSVVNDNAAVRLNVYDLTGRFVTSLLNNRLSAGNYSIPLAASNLSAQPYVLTINVNGISKALRFTPVGQGTMSGSVASIPASASRLEKVLALTDTIKVTKPGYAVGKLVADVSVTGPYDFKLGKTTTWNGDTVAFWGDRSKYPTDGQYVIINRTNGAFPDSKISYSYGMNATKTSITQSPSVKITGNGRFYVWVAPTDSNNRYFDFVEFNWNAANGGWPGNTTRVDGFRLPITFLIHQSNGKDIVLGEKYELYYQPRKTLFDEFVNEVPKEFTALATHDFANIWAPHTSPVNLFGKDGPYVNYFKDYQDTVKKYNSDALAPNAYASDIFACAGGGMGSSPTWSASLNRHYGHIPHGTNYVNWKDPKTYYRGAPCNYFSRWSHRRSVDNKSYGFPYDDVYEQAAFVGATGVQYIVIAIGW